MVVTLKASDRGAVVRLAYSLSLAFQFWRFYLGFKFVKVVLFCEDYLDGQNV